MQCRWKETRSWGLELDFGLVEILEDFYTLYLSVLLQHLLQEALLRARRKVAYAHRTVTDFFSMPRSPEQDISVHRS